MSRVLPVLLSIGLTIYCLIDALQTDEAAIRNLPKPFWILLIVLFPIVGPVAWLFAGRPPGPGERRALAWPSGLPQRQHPPRMTAPDDDPEFLASLQGLDTEHKKMLEKWEADLRERERRLRGDDHSGSGSPDGEEPTGGTDTPPAS